jgi:SAM-dependent methyltransferase
MDLGSGDGRTVIAAARRGSRALGIEYNPNMVELSRANAKAAGVPTMATFQEADIFQTDFSRANVLTLFLLPSLNLKLRPTILEMAPGTRVVSNTFTMDDWEADETVTIDNCSAWCTALLWIVPAKVDGTWDVGGQPLQLTQEFQMLSGTLGANAISNARMRGEAIAFMVGARRYSGTVKGNSMSGTIEGGGRWTATRR